MIVIGGNKSHAVIILFNSDFTRSPLRYVKTIKFNFMTINDYIILIDIIEIIANMIII